MSLLIPKLAVGDEQGEGAGWFAIDIPATPNEVILRCACGSRAALVFGPNHHSIDAVGNVSPSMVCPNNCGWHVYGRLADWDRGARP